MRVFTGRPPSPPPPPETIQLPVIAMVVPLALSLVMALVLHSPLALLMGIVGPAMVAAGWLHQRKALTQRESGLWDDFHQAETDFRAHREEAHQVERAEARRALPELVEWMSDPLWRREQTPSSVVRIGQGMWMPPAGHPLAGTGMVVAMPAGIDTTHGLALVAGADSVDLWRHVVTQWVVASGRSGLDPIPRHSGEELARDYLGISRLTWVRDISEVPPECGIVMVPQGLSLVTLTEAGEPTREIRPDRLSQAQMLWALRKLDPSSQCEEGEGVDVPPRSHLIAQLSVMSAEVNLVQEGPHVVVWGATGSGKSVTVCTLVLSLARRYPPRDMVLVLIDFKGGAGLRPLDKLPHAVGMVSDLDPRRSERVRAGLVSEMVKRERIMAQHGVADIVELGDDVWCPRLLVIVDEVAWLCQTAPEWTDTLSDLARRGRSLGIHVVLSTQRVTGVLPRELMSNISLRLCARVSDPADVMEWMPDASASLASALRHSPPGRLLVSGALTRPAWHSVTPGEIPQSSYVAPSPPWRVWSEDLPELVAPESGIWAIEDRLETQTHGELRDSPLTEGSVLVVGDRASGRTNAGYALAALAPGSVLAPSDPAGLWQCLRDLQGRRATLVIDDADMLLHKAGGEGESFLMDALEGFDGSLALMVSPRHRLTRGLARIAQGRVVLWLAHSDDAAGWGAPGVALPGRAQYQGLDIQIVYPAPVPDLWSQAPLDPLTCAPIVISHHPERWSALETRFLGTADQAMASWHLLSGELAETPVVLDAVSHRDARHASAGRISLPPLTPEPGWCWIWRAGRTQLVSAADLGGL